MKKHSVIISGHATSLSIEPEFWTAFTRLAQANSTPLSHLIQEIDDTRTGNLSSAIRLYVLKSYTEIIENQQAQKNPINDKDAKR